MKKRDIKKATSNQLRSKLRKIYKIQDSDRYHKFDYIDNLEKKISEELYKRQHAELYRVCCEVLNTNGRWNQFEYASGFTRGTCCDEIDPLDETYEIESCYTKSGNSETVYF